MKLHFLTACCQEKTAKADANGDWRVTLDPLAAAAPTGDTYAWAEKPRGSHVVESGNPNPEGGNTSAASAQAGPELGLGDIIRQPAYWYIGISLGLLFSVYTAILANITPYATSLGTTAAQASSLIMAVAVMGLVGKLVFGMAADKINLKFGLWIAMALVFLAFLLLAGEPGYPVMLLAAGLMGLAAGGMLPVWGEHRWRVHWPDEWFSVPL